MKFDINNYPGKYVMHCKTEEEAQIFTSYLHRIGKTWVTGSSYTDQLGFAYGEDSCYNFNKGTHANINTYKDASYTILEFENFDWDDISLSEIDIKTIDDFMSQFKIN